MSESKKSDIEISKALGEINDKLDKIIAGKTNLYFSAFSVGLSCALVGIILVATEGNSLLYGIILVIVGLVFYVGSLVAISARDSRKDRQV